jgi:outer membrane protein assembly factor BamA
MQAPARCGAIAALLLLGTSSLLAAQAPTRDGWEVAGLPTVNYDSDEGFGYGATAEVYYYGRPGVLPYRFTLQPDIQFTTQGRRDLSVFFDAPELLGGGMRLDVFAGYERLSATPFYGLGNESVNEPTRVSDVNPYFYRYGRTRGQVRVNLQRPLGSPRVRVLAGAGIAHTEVDPTPKDQGVTLLSQSLQAIPEAQRELDGWSNWVRAGLVYDTRDREVGPQRGMWADLIVQRVDRALGSDWSYWRVTLTDRHYFPVTPRLILAQRVLLQTVLGDAPFFDLTTIQSSFKPQEGLGGSKTLRGALKNRYTGNSLALSNTELRWRAADFQLAGRPFHLVTSGFVDAGRVWEEDLVLSELASDLHLGVGGGLRLGMGENFVVAVDVGHSREATAAVYIGLGYLY